MNENIKLLIEKATKLTQERNKKIKEKLLTFNIFDICDISYDEVKVCRFLWELLNPKGRHLQGIKYLKLFFKEVLKYNELPTDEELSDSIVKREEGIKNERRIDISILSNVKGNRQYIPIEVKIYAGDQENQCYDYYQHSLNMNGKNNEKAYVYYLTPFGNYPSLSSLKNFNPIVDENGEVIDCKEVKTISFKDEIYNWINACISEANDNKLISEKQVLLQFKKIIDDIGENNMEKQEINDILKQININEETFNAAKLIRDNFQMAANEKMKKFYDLLYDELINEKDSKWKWEKESTLDLDLKEYAKTTGKRPTIYKDIPIKDVKCELAITTEGDGKPFFGVSLKQGEDKSKENVLTDFFKDKLLNNNGYSYGWITRQYLPNEREAPNFKHFNENYYALFNDEKCKLLIEKCVETIREFENKICNSL